MVETFQIDQAIYLAVSLKHQIILSAGPTALKIAIYDCLNIFGGHFFFFFFLIQFYVPFKIISLEDPKKKQLAHPQAELGLSHMWPERGSNPHQTQR